MVLGRETFTKFKNIPHIGRMDIPHEGSVYMETYPQD
jgi:hypothetical protein